jgi:hypothetical protein
MFEQRTCYMVDYGELEAAIKKHYGQSLEILSDLECSNDSAHVFDLTGFLEWDEERVQMWLKDSNSICYMAQDLLAKMASKGAIPCGYYVMEVCW